MVINVPGDLRVTLKMLVRDKPHPGMTKERRKVMTKRIFVVDDEPIIADSLATILNNSGNQASAF